LYLLAKILAMGNQAAQTPVAPVAAANSSVSAAPAIAASVEALSSSGGGGSCEKTVAQAQASSTVSGGSRGVADSERAQKKDLQAKTNLSKALKIRLHTNLAVHTWLQWALCQMLKN
jgi:hypothetical protein